jgi:hypothetical protein
MNKPVSQMSPAAQIARLEKTVGQLLKMKQSELAAPDAVNTAADKMHNNLQRSLPSALRPLNVGEYSNVVWSYFFPMVSGIIAPNTALDVLTNVTQEAAFIMTHMFPVVYEYTSVLGVNQFNHVANMDVLPLRATLVDAQSSRQFMAAPEPLALFGTNEFPRKLPTPNFYLPTSTIVARISNDSPSKYYKVCFVLLGARVRVDEAQNIRGTMVGG